MTTFRQTKEQAALRAHGRRIIAAHVAALPYECEDCGGRGTVPTLPYEDEMTPPLPMRCERCRGFGRTHIPPALRSAGEYLLAYYAAQSEGALDPFDDDGGGHGDDAL